MSLDATAIEKLQESTTVKAIAASASFDRPAVAMPDNFKMVDLEKYQEFRNSYRGSFLTESIKSFGNYHSHHALDDAECHVDQDSMSAQTIFDLGDHDEPRHCEHTATISLKKTADFKALLELNGRKIGQQALAEWLEDWRDQVSPYLENEDSMDIKKAIASIRNVKIKATAEANHEQSDFAASSSRMGTISAESAHGNVAGFQFTCKPYSELDDTTFTVRLSLLTGDDKPIWIPRIIQLEKRQQEMAEEFMDKLTTELDGQAVELFLGTFNSK